ncbi:metal-dependent hydrolase, beta-lactamase superfamily I [Sphaerochaeta pleomorpha str. Grapes]|uniref:Metal-dependent hydrolase, beta-lactamase superfamily I n=1 Tax=Sphaerochaeta pleomorpha (strain ATCC BAA-1885 / DSM 22778 / Grapes) TaxID=158190 RepID=G8QR70_SPHPG|nr:MBL fold metallo-hydrolase [Sphaerochaeta pleomorpha]AEV31005.1 metal-dependent hydrolase, beta-lactamase superfamily I [Sphaerochaeta pleomorpha str. Grapes]
MVQYAVLGTGSNGNSYVFSDGTTSILVDQGYSVVELGRRLSSFGIEFSSIAGVCVTHLHPDHAKGLGTIARKFGIPIYIHEVAQEKEAEALSRLSIPQHCLRSVKADVPFTIGPFTLGCFLTSHDSGGSVGWNIGLDNKKMMILTDTGCFSSQQCAFATEADVLFLEANYDEKMLNSGPYPFFLKKRVSGEFGHLSNNQAIEFLGSSRFHGQHVYFIHLSDINNNPSLLEDFAGQNLSVPFTVCEKGKCYGGNVEQL